MSHSQAPDSILHVFLTRFNVRSGGKEQRLRQRPEWLAQRFDLFDTYCWPSMKAQTRQDFVWLVFFDSETPQEFKDRIQRCAEWSVFRPVFVDGWNSQLVHDAIQAELEPHHQYLLTSRLDNDDGLHRSFVADLRDAIAPPAAAFFIFPDGLIYREGRVYSHRDESNAFASYFEPVADFQTVWKTPHHEIYSKHKVVHVGLPYRWFQVVHGTNVSNRVKGRRIHRADWHEGYDHLRHVQLASDSAVAFAFERLISTPARNLRELAVRTLKPLLKPTRHP